MKTRTVYEIFDKVRYTGKKDFRVSVNVKALNFGGDKDDERNYASVLLTFPIKPGALGEIVDDDEKTPNRFTRVRFHLEDVPFDVHVTALLLTETLEYVPLKKKSVSTIEGDTFTAHGKGPGK